MPRLQVVQFIEIWKIRLAQGVAKVFFIHISHILERGPVGVKKREKIGKKKKIELLLILSKFIL